MYTSLVEGNTTDQKGRIIYTSVQIAFISLRHEKRNNRGGATERKTESHPQAKTTA